MLVEEQTPLSAVSPQSPEGFFSGQDWRYEQKCSFLVSESLLFPAAHPGDLEGYVTEPRACLNLEI